MCYCYYCEHFVGPVEDEEWEEDETIGMCPLTGVYTDAFDDACKELLLRKSCEDKNLI